MVIHYRPEIAIVSQIPSSGDFFRSYSAVYKDFGKETLVRIQIVSEISDQRKQHLIEAYFSIFENDDLNINDILESISSTLT